jgi:hypothetical protein
MSNVSFSTANAGLDALEARLREDLAWLELPAPAWVPARFADGARVLDVAIVGAGMAGLTAAAELRMLGIDNLQLFDQAAAAQEGPWVTYARMNTLRSPKQLTGPALRFPALTFRAWYEAQFGREQWDALNKIPRTQWMDYLRWYRKVLSLPVVNDTRLAHLAPRDDGLIALDLHTQLGRAARSRGTSFSRRAAKGSAALMYRPLRTRCLRIGTPTLRIRSISTRCADAVSAWSAAARLRSTMRRVRSKPVRRASTCSSGARKCRASTSSRASAVRDSYMVSSICPMSGNGAFCTTLRSRKPRRRATACCASRAMRTRGCISAAR